MRKLKWGLRNYNGKFPFECFNYGQVGHYASKCPKKKKKDYDPKEKIKKVQKDQKKAKQKYLYVKEESFSESEPLQSLDEDRDDNNPKEFMLMAIKNLLVEVIFDGDEG